MFLTKLIVVKSVELKDESIIFNYLLKKRAVSYKEIESVKFTSELENGNSSPVLDLTLVFTINNKGVRLLSTSKNIMIKSFVQNKIDTFLTKNTDGVIDENF